MRRLHRDRDGQRCILRDEDWKDQPAVFLMKVRRRMGSTGLAETEALATTKATVRSDEEVGSCVVRAL